MHYSPSFSSPQWSNETTRVAQLFPAEGIFLTGIEGSDPWVDGTRRNQLKEAHDFYTHYRERLTKIRELGITWLRFGMPYSQVHLDPHTFDFSFMDNVVTACDELGITIMADLLHFGLPDWIHEDTADAPFFQNPRFPVEFAKYAYAFAKRYPHIRFYTVVNEPFVTAFLSAKLGLWNEQHGSYWEDDKSFVKATAHIAEAAILARIAIEQVWKDENHSKELVFVQNESFEEAFATEGSGRQAEAERFNLRRFAPLDLIFGHRDETMRAYLMSQGLSDQAYEWFMQHGSMTKTVLGIDHYPSCIHRYEAERTVDHSPHDSYQLYAITKTYWQRYPLPLLHTEVNAWPKHAEAICQKTFDALAQLREEGYPVLGMGWYGDDLQIGWHVAMRGPRSNEENPVGLFYKGQIQPITKQFQTLLRTGFPDIAHPNFQPVTVPQHVSV